MNKLLFNDIYDVDEVEFILTMIQRDKDVVVIFYKPDVSNYEVQSIIQKLNDSIHHQFQNDIKDFDILYYMIVETSGEYDDFYFIRNIDTYELDKIQCTNIFQYLNK